MPVNTLSIGPLTPANGSLSGTVTITGTPESYPYNVNLLINDVNSVNVLGESFKSSSVSVTSGLTADFTITGLTNGILYSVVAHDNHGIRSAQAEGKPSSPPLAPIFSVISRKQDSVTLRLDRDLSQGSDHKVSPLFYKAVHSATMTKVDIPAFSYSDKTAPYHDEITITGLITGDTYEFVGHTCNDLGLSPLSNTVQATPSNVVDKPNIPILTQVLPDATNMAAVKSTITMPTDWRDFTIFDPSNNIVPPVAKFILISDFSVAGSITSLTHTLDPVVASSDANGTKHYSGTFTPLPVTLQISATSTSSLSVTVKGRSQMTTGNNPNLIDDQSSASSDILYVAGNVGMAASTNSEALKASVTVDPSGNMNKVVVKPYFLSVPVLTGFTNHIRVVAEGDNQTSTLLSNPSAQTFVASLQSGATTLNFLVTDVIDFTKTAILQVRSSFTAPDSSTTIYTKWVDATISSFGLWSKPDALSSFDIIESSQSGAPAFEITANLPTVNNMKGLILRDYLLQAKTTNGVGSTNWVPYDAISNAFTGILYKSILPDGTPFIKGTSYSFSWAVRGSVTPTSPVISGSAAFASGVLTANAFKTLKPDVVNADSKSTVYLPNVAWVDASGSISAYSAIINFTEDPSGNNYIPVTSRKAISIVYAVSFAGGIPEDVVQSSKLFDNLTNGNVYKVAIQARFTYNTLVVYSEVYNIELKPAGVPLITVSPDNIYKFSTLIGGVSGSSSAATYALAAATTGVVVSSIQSVFKAIIDNKGSALISYSTIYIPQDYNTSITTSQIMPPSVNFIDVPANFVNGVLTLTPVGFVAKACILYVTNGNGSTSIIIPGVAALN